MGFWSIYMGIYGGGTAAVDSTDFFPDSAAFTRTGLAGTTVERTGLAGTAVSQTGLAGSTFTKKS